MFKKTKAPESTLFESPSNLMRGRALEKYDPDASYRTKGDQKVKGYSMNATETNDEEGGLSLITDVEVRPATRAGNKWRIASKGKAKYRYFTQEQAEKAMLRKKIEAIPKKELDRRNNVEAAMFQISYHTRNGKTRYRGLAKHVIWACARCMWMNFIRLVIFQTTTCQRTLFGLFGPIWRHLGSRLKHFREYLLMPRYILCGSQTVSFRTQFDITA